MVDFAVHCTFTLLKRLSAEQNNSKGSNNLDVGTFWNLLIYLLRKTLMIRNTPEIERFYVGNDRHTNNSKTKWRLDRYVCIRKGLKLYL